jgi:hypothetical protein
MVKPFQVVEKRRLFLPPDPPKKGRCSYVAWNGARCQRPPHEDEMVPFHFYLLEPNAKHVRIMVKE